MRALELNKRPISYATLDSTEPLLDEYGNETLEVRKLYTPPKTIKVNYSSNVGEDITQVFGNMTEYSRVICLCEKECPFKENTIVWIGKPTTEKANYEVYKVADSLNGYLIALKEIV